MEFVFIGGMALVIYVHHEYRDFFIKKKMLFIEEWLKKKEIHDTLSKKE